MTKKDLVLHSGSRSHIFMEKNVRGFKGLVTTVIKPDGDVTKVLRKGECEVLAKKVSGCWKPFCLKTLHVT